MRFYRRVEVHIYTYIHMLENIHYIILKRHTLHYIKTKSNNKIFILNIVVNLLD